MKKSKDKPTVSDETTLLSPGLEGNSEPKQESKEKKKFKETKLFKFLEEKVPGVLDVVDDYFPPAKILTALVKPEESLSLEDAHEFKKLLLDQELEMYKVEVDDRKSARLRETEYVKAGKTDWMMMILGFSMLASFLFSLVMLMFGFTDDSPIVYHLLGIIEGAILAMMYYYWGSSKDSRKKTEMLSKVVK